LSDAGHSGSGDLEDGVTLYVPSFSFLLFSLLLSFFWISAQYKLRWPAFLPPLEISQVVLEFPGATDLPKSCPQQYQSVVGIMGSYVFVR
jgi:hypothetical protein